jgi:hypothetical protein
MFKTWETAVIAGSIWGVLEMASGPPASALDRPIELANNTRMAIVEIYAAPVGTGRWRRDLLGDEILPPANSILVNMENTTGNCRFDVKVIFDDGTSLLRRDVNLCELDRYAISYR